MSFFRFLVLSGGGTILLLLLVAFFGPRARYYSGRAKKWVDTSLDDHDQAWSFRETFARMKDEQRHSHQEFLRWLRLQVNGEWSGAQIDEDLVEAQKLTPLLRFLLQDEIPNSIRRCNGLHRRMALISGAPHMRDVAYEPECLGLRRWMVHLLINTDTLLQRYPLRLRLEADDLLSASVVVRKSLLPICARCPYIQCSVAVAGERCPAAKLIQLEVTHE